MDYLDRLHNAQKNDGVIIHQIKTDAGNLENKIYADIRCGLFWPGPSMPAFYIIIGEEYGHQTKYEGEKPPPSKLIFMVENEVPGIYLEPLFKHITDDCSLLGCSTIYTDLDETKEDIQDKKQLYDNFCKDGNIYISMLDAPYRTNWEMGVNLVRRFTDKGLLKISDGPTRAQLSAAVAQDLDGQDDSMLYSLRALQYVVGSYHKSPASHGGIYRPRRGKQSWC